MMISLLPSGFRRLRLNPLCAGVCIAIVSTLWICASLGVDGNQPEGGSKYEEPKWLAGTIYERGSEPQKPLFRFRRQTTRSGSILRVARDFTYPDGKEAAREEVVYEGNNLISLVLREFQTGARGSVRVRRLPGETDCNIEFEYLKNPSSALKMRTEVVRDTPLIADTVVPFLMDHWEALMRGEKVKCRVVVLERLETVGFTFLKESGPDAKGGEIVTIKMEPTSRIIAAIVAPLYFRIEKAAPHRVLEYSGRTTPKLNVHGKWEDLDAMTIFDWK